jgi:hypothetical protein
LPQGEASALSRRWPRRQDRGSRGTPGATGFIDANKVKQQGARNVASQGLSEEDQHRMRDFMLACGSLMMARTRLKPDDRQICERELRAAVANQGGCR